MAPTTPAGTSPDFDNVHALFERAIEQPENEREEFVRREAGEDTALRDRVLHLLRAAQAVEATDFSLRLAADHGRPPAHGGTAERVQSTATSELLARLQQAPKLDTVRYELQDEIARGGMGVILGLRDRHLNRKLAMKVLLEREAPRSDFDRQLAHQLLGRFLEEAQVTSQLDHPGVVPVHELGLDQTGRVYFTMRLVKGRTCSDVFAESHAGAPEWPLTRALEVILKVCDTMAFAHDKGVLHRDLKPGNVMVGRFGEVYVMDWGLAKVIGQEDRRDLRIRPEAASTQSEIDSARRHDAETDDFASVVSMDGQKLGTPSYMPPEQARSEQVDQRADVYAIGAMLYELLTGCAPYTVPGVRKAAYRILDDVVVGPPRRIEELQPGVPAELVAICDKAMHRGREQRFANTQAMAADLRAFLAQRAVQAYRTGALVELELWVRRNKPLAASLAAAVAILVGAVVLTSWLANENAALAQQKTELAAKETKAREDAARRAEENEKLAQSEAAAREAATKLAQDKSRTVANFHQLSGVVRLKDALAKQEKLWPAWPDKVAALRSWLEQDCAQLLRMRPQVEATLAELRRRALPLSAEQVEADRRASPDWPAYLRQQQIVASLRRAQRIRTGAAKLELPELPASLRDADAAALHAFAWARVAPEQDHEEAQEREVFGEEQVALAAARAAVAKAAMDEVYRHLSTLAWAELASGQDEAARRCSAEALADAPDRDQEAYAKNQRAIETAIDQATSRLVTAEAKLGELEAKVSIRRTWTFGSDEEGESARFLHDALAGLLQGLDELETEEKADTELRLQWAIHVKAASSAHPRARVTWAEARAAIAKADGVVASTLYAGKQIELRDEVVVGLVPIGMNPVTKLWEFYDLRSAWDGNQAATEIEIPQHRPDDGSIEVTGDTGIVFVLLPGGTAMLGSQSNDEAAPFYDPQHRAGEELHQVTLSPFLLARHELTQGQWSRLWTWDDRLREPSEFKAGKTVVSRTITWANPVESVSWTMCDMLLQRHGLVLPTEAQWEYGCRAGTTTAWVVALGELKLFANLATLEPGIDPQREPQTSDGVFEPWQDGHLVHAPVGRFKANAFGLHDMHGNAWEWCRDWFGAYGTERAGDGLRAGRPVAGRVGRGGSFGYDASRARSAKRDGGAATLRSDDIGVRPARLLTN